MATTKKPFVILSIVGFMTLFSFTLTGQAQQPIDMVSCGDSKITTIVSSEELTIMGVEGKGINMDNLPSKIYDNMTYHGVGILKIEKGKFSGSFYYKYMDPGGDFFVVEVSQVGMEREWKYIHGTGKWKGITGAGKGFPITKGKAISPGTSQGCMKITGTYELKK
jgi:hypothetical protein